MELSMPTIKRLLLAVCMFCLAATANATPMDDADAAYKKGDYEKAFALYKKLSINGNLIALTHIGWMYAIGHGVTKNCEEALQSYRSSLTPYMSQIPLTIDPITKISIKHSFFSDGTMDAVVLGRGCRKVFIHRNAEGNFYCEADLDL